MLLRLIWPYSITHLKYIKMDLLSVYWEVALLYNRTRMLWTIIIILLVLWALGFSFKIGGSLIHLLLVVALVVLVIRLF